jgi:hypothetical protein
MRYLRCFLALVLVGALSACASTKFPIGIAGGAQSDARLVGTWQAVDTDDHGKQTIWIFAFAKPDSGDLDGLFVTPPGGRDKPGWGSVIVVVGKIGERGFLNARALMENGKPTHSDPPDSYAAFTYRLEGDRLTLHALDYDRVRAAIGRHDIAGDDANITADSAALDRYVAAHPDALFSERKIVLNRVTTP